MGCLCAILTLLHLVTVVTIAMGFWAANLDGVTATTETHPILGWTLRVLSFPLGLLGWHIASVWSNVDGVLALIILSVCNSVLWGFGVGELIRSMRRQRRSD